MSAEGWGSDQGSGRSYGNSGGGGGGYRSNGGGGYQGGRQNSYGGGGAGGGGGGGYGQRNGSGGGGGGYGGGNGGGFRSNQTRPPRQNFGQGGRTGGAGGGGAGGGGGGYNNIPQGSPSSMIEIQPDKVGMVIGRGGGKIREIQDLYNVHVKIDRDPGANGLTGVTIRGDETAIQGATDYIQDLVAIRN